MSVLELGNVEVRHHGRVFLSEINMVIERGDIYLLVGKSGAGKTTVAGIASGQIIPSGGCVRLFAGSSIRRRKRLGALVGRPPFFVGLNMRDNLVIRALSLGVPNAEAAIDALIEELGLGEFALDKVETLPAGILSWVGFAWSLIGSPDFLILDGIFSGLDPIGRSRMSSALLRLSRERETAILITSREIGGLSTIATRFGVLADGSLSHEFSSEELSRELESTICVRTDATEKTLVRLEEAFSRCDISLREDGILEVSGPTLDAVSRALFSFPERVIELSERHCLEDDLIRRGGRRDADIGASRRHVQGTA